MTIKFSKYQGTGNDFVMIDNRDKSFEKNNNKLIEKLCDRRFGIGGDGLILLENSNEYDFRMVYFNSDGHEGSMCGNGGRCCVAFAKQLGVISDETRFIAVDGEHEATVKDGLVNLKMSDVSFISKTDKYYYLNTGSPHHVEFSENVSEINIKDKGAKIRYGAPYFDEGTNVNFAEKINSNTIKVRTYERGVEDETLSCGTGVTAVAISAYAEELIENNKVNIEVEGGKLEVSFNKDSNGFKNIFLKGPATFVYDGKIEN